MLGLASIVALLGGLFGMALAVKNLFFTRVDPDKQFVTRSELAAAVHGLDTKIEELKGELAGRIEKSSDYARSTAHEQANTLHAMGLKLERLLAMREAALGLRSIVDPTIPVPVP